MLSGNHVFPRQERLVYGFSAAQVLPDDAARNGWKRAFVISSRSVAVSDYAAAIIAALGSRIAGIYPGVTAHSPIASVIEAANSARACAADVIIALGGGSVIDAAKMAQACLWTGIDAVVDLPDFAARHARTRHQSPNPRLIAIPTTLSAAEFTHIAGITDPQTGIKHIFEAAAIIPRLVILDPAATRETPMRLMLGTGIRAVDHCVETLCSIAPTPYGDATAAEGLRRLPAALRALHANPDDLAARLECQLGAWMAISGPASGVPAGASHAVGRVLGGAFGVAHGETSCVMLPAALNWNRGYDDGAQARVAALMGHDGPAANAVAALVADLGLPGSLRAVGVAPDAFGEIADKTLLMIRHHATSGNRRPIRAARDVLEILALAAG
ncbi:MAG: iron-containing alcohol dehydrogenase [Sphingomonas sp.]|jgi:maleylacetate reductase